MDIQFSPDSFNKTNVQNSPKKREKVATAFEKIFARELVQTMTKGLFKHDDKGTMLEAGSGINRQHIVNTLSKELAKQHKLGIANMITSYLNKNADH